MRRRGIASPAPFSPSSWSRVILRQRKAGLKTSTAMVLSSGGSLSHADTVSRRRPRRPTHWPKSSVPSRAKTKIFDCVVSTTYPGTGRDGGFAHPFSHAGRPPCCFFYYIHGACHVGLCRLVPAYFCPSRPLLDVLARPDLNFGLFVRLWYSVFGVLDFVFWMLFFFNYYLYPGAGVGGCALCSGFFPRLLLLRTLLIGFLFLYYVVLPNSYIETLCCRTKTPNKRKAFERRNITLEVLTEQTGFVCL